MNFNSLARLIRILKSKKVKKKSEVVRWGIIGTGYMAETFGTAIDGSSDGIIIAVASRTMNKAEIYASHHRNCIAYEGYNEFLKNDNIDVVYISTPVNSHYNIIEICLNAGKNVLCEKPIVLTQNQLIELKKLAKSKGCFLMEAMWMKCLPTYQKGLDWVSNGLIGNVDLIKVDFYKNRIIDSNANYENIQDYEIMYDYGVYAISFVVGFMSKIEEIDVHSRKSSLGFKSDYFIYLNDNKIQAYVNISSNFNGSSKAAVIGQKGYIEWEAQFNRTNRITLFDSTGKKIECFKCKYDYEGFEYEVNEVQSCILRHLQDSDKSPIFESMTTLKIIEKIICD